MEDEKNIVDILRFNLQRAGYQTLEAYDGEDGLAQAVSANPDLILLDVMLPKKNGFDVCRALRENGHRAILVDLFLGLEEVPADLETLFDAPDGLCPDAKIEVEAPDLETVKRGRKDQGPSHIGPHVLDICQKADLVFLGLHGMDGEDGRIQAALDLLGVPYTGAGHLASAVAMDKAVSKQILDACGIPTPKWRLLSYGLDEAEPLAQTLPMPASSRPSGAGRPWVCTYRRTGRS